MYSYTIEPDGEGFIARITGVSNVFAYAETPEKAKTELVHVIDMMIDYQQEVLTNQKRMRASFA